MDANSLITVRKQKTPIFHDLTQKSDFGYKSCPNLGKSAFFAGIVKDTSA